MPSTVSIGGYYALNADVNNDGVVGCGVDWELVGSNIEVLSLLMSDYHIIAHVFALEGARGEGFISWKTYWPKNVE